MLLPLLGLAALLTAAYVGGRSAKKAAIEATTPGLFVVSPALPQISAPRARAESKAPPEDESPEDESPGVAFPQLRPRLTVPKARSSVSQRPASQPPTSQNKSIPPTITKTLAKIKARTATAQECLEGMAWLAAKSPQSNPSASPFYAGLKQAKGEVEAAKILARFRAKQLEKRHRGR